VRDAVASGAPPQQRLESRVGVGRRIPRLRALGDGIARRPFDVSDLVNLLIQAESKKAA